MEFNSSRIVLVNQYGRHKTSCEKRFITFSRFKGIDWRAQWPSCAMTDWRFDWVRAIWLSRRLTLKTGRSGWLNFFWSIAVGNVMAIFISPRFALWWRMDAVIFINQNDLMQHFFFNNLVLTISPTLLRNETAIQTIWISTSVSQWNHTFTIPFLIYL